MSYKKYHTENQRGRMITTDKNKLTDEEVCRAIIALANLVYIENGSHDIHFRKEQNDNRTREKRNIKEFQD